MHNIFSDILSKIADFSSRPLLFTPGEQLFWNDPHISKSMLEAHLNPDNDLASRRHATIEKEVDFLLSSGILKRGDNLLDLGCGPGLYTSRFAEKGLYVTGIDISERSLNYATAQAKINGLDIRYRLMDFFALDYTGEFDAVIQTNGELNTFPDDKRNELLAKLHKALKPGGLLIFDVTTRELRRKYGLKNGWYFSDGGFWRPGQHLVLEHGFDYPEHDVRLDQFIVLDKDRMALYNNWFHDYSLDTLRPVIDEAGFKILHVWSSLAGADYREDSDWIAVAAVKL